MARHADIAWVLPDTVNYDAAQLAVLMDIRDELQRMNAVLHCQDFIAIPQKLDAIEQNTRKPVRRKKAR